MNNYETIEELQTALRDLVEVCTVAAISRLVLFGKAYATFDNGVTAPDGSNEANYWAGIALDNAKAILDR